MRRPRRDEDVLAGKRPRPRTEQRHGGIRDLDRLRHAAEASLAAFRHFAGIRSDREDAVGAQLRDIALGCRMLPHARVHGGRDQHRLVGREQHGRGEIVGEPVGHFGNQVGGRRCHHDQISVAREPDMTDVEFAHHIEQIDERGLARERAG